MKSHLSSAPKIAQLVFEEDDLFDQERMVDKLDFLIHAWGHELLQKGYMDKTPSTDDDWIRFLDMEVYWRDLKEPWDHYLVGCLIFFVQLRADIKRDFLLQPDSIRGQKLGWRLHKLRRYISPLLRNLITAFCLCYSTVSERKPITVRFTEIQ